MDKTRPSFADNPLPKREERQLNPRSEDFDEHKANHKISAMISNCLMANFQDQRSIYDLIYELEVYGYQSGDKQAFSHALRAKDILQHLIADNLNYLAIMEYYNGMNAIAPNAGDALEVLATAHANGVLDEEIDIDRRKRAEYLNNNSIYNTAPTPPPEDTSQHEIELKPKPVEVQDAIKQDGENELLPVTETPTPTEDMLPPSEESTTEEENNIPVIKGEESENDNTVYRGEEETTETAETSSSEEL